MNRSLLRLGGRAGAFLSVNAAAQVANLVAGFLLIRWMTVHDYAIYTVAMGLTAAVSVLTKGGVHLAVTALLGKYWPDQERIGGLLKAALASRRKISIIALPGTLGLGAYLLHKNGASLVELLLLLAGVCVFWWADMRIRVVDQVVVFAGQTHRLQVLEFVMAGVRLVLLAGGMLAGLISAAFAVGTAVLLAVARVPVIRGWVAALGPDMNATPRPEDVRQLHATLVRQLPVDLFTVFQTQVIVITLTITTGATQIASYGALSRIAQVFLPVQALCYAFFIPSFVSATSGIGRRLLKISALAAAPGCALVVLTIFAPQAILWTLGPSYAGLKHEALLMTITSTLMSVSGVAWTMVANRGWNKWAWLQIPVGIGWVAIAPLFLNLRTLSGAIWLQVGFAAGLLVATFADLAWAYRTKRARLPEEREVHPDDPSAAPPQVQQARP